MTRLRRFSSLWGAAILTAAFWLPATAQDSPRPRVRIDRLADIGPAVYSCWRLPRGLDVSGQEMTVLVSFKRTGEVLGRRITYYKAGGNADQREAFTRAVRETFEHCTPLFVTDELGAAIAGRPFTFRFSDTRHM